MQMPLFGRRFGALVLPLYLCLSNVVFISSASGQETNTTDEEIIVTASRIESSPSALASSVTVVDSEEIEEGQYSFVRDALRRVPGLDIVQSGPIGGNAAAFLRGANSEHTLVLLDGIELNNPASTNRSFNFSTLTLENIDRIEIVRGPQSTLYGSDALGGVINIISKRAKPGFGASASAEAGSYNSFTETVGASWGSNLFDVTTGVTRQDIGNVSSAGAKYGNTEADDFENTSASGRVRVFPSDLVDVGLTTRYNRGLASLDNFGGVGGDDPNRRLDNEEFFTRGDATTHFLDDSLSQTISIAYSKHELTDNNDPDASSMDFLRSSFNGDLFELNAQNRWTPCKGVSVVVGAETERERADSSYLSDGAFGPFEDNLAGHSARTNGYYTEGQVSYDERVFFGAGIRIDDHSKFGSQTTFRLAPAFLVTKLTKLRGSVGTWYKAPSLVQLYSSFGNPNLEAEESTGWDVGVDQELIEKRWSVSATYFRNELDNLVTFNSSTFVLENIQSAETAGFETATSVSLTDALTVRGSYTYTDSEDESTEESLLRRPRNKGSLSATYAFTERLDTQIGWRVYGGRFDNDFSGAAPTRVRLGGYGLVDLAASYRVSDSVELTTRIENLFDKEYEDVLGYGTLGLAAYGGVKVSL